VVHGGVDLDPTVNAMIVDVTADSSVPIPELFDEVAPVEPLPVTSVVSVPGGVQDRDGDGIVQERASDLIEDSSEAPAVTEPAVEEPVADTAAALQPDPVAVDQLADSGETSTGTVAMHVQLKAVLNNAIAQQASLTATLGLQNRAPTQAPGDPARLLAESPDFRNALDNLKDHVTDQTAIYEAAARSGTVLATGLSIGYVAWLAKGGLMTASLVTSLPLWRIFDPIPVLVNMDDSCEREDGEGESLASMFESQEEIEQPAANKDVGNAVLPSDAEDVMS